MATQQADETTAYRDALGALGDALAKLPTKARLRACAEVLEVANDLTMEAMEHFNLVQPENFPVMDRLLICSGNMQSTLLYWGAAGAADAPEAEPEPSE